MHHLEVDLFGGVTIRADEITLTGLHNGKTLELFCCLLLNRGRYVSRSRLIECLWESAVLDDPAKRLSQVLSELQTDLKRVLGLDGTKRILTTTADSVRCRPDGLVRIDAAEFEDICREVLESPQPDSPEHWRKTEHAVHLYRGDLLGGKCPRWCRAQGEYFKHLCLELINKLIEHAENTEQSALGVKYACKGFEIDPDSEQVLFRLMRLHHATGNRTAAAKAYQQYADRMERTYPGFGAHPLLTALYADIAANKSPSHLTKWIGDR